MSSEEIAFTSCVRHDVFPYQPQWRDIENQIRTTFFYWAIGLMDYGYRFFSRE